MVPNVADVPKFEPPRSTKLHTDRAPRHDLGDADLDETPELGIGTRVVEPHVRFDEEIAAPSSEASPRLRSTDPAELEAQIRALEARLDGLIRRAAVPSEPPPPPSIGDHLSAPDSVPAAAASSAEPAIVTRDTAATEYVERQWGRGALRSRLEEVDDFGLDPSFESKLLPGIDLLYRRYFRVQVEGIHHVPSVGRAVIVANHGGTLPLDGAMLRTAIRLDHPSRRDLRWLAEDFVFYLPFAGVFLNRIGAVRACPENAERLLEKDSLVAVFPEGVHGIKKLFRQRYQLQRFGRGGFIRLCLRMRAPLIPCAIIGAEETNPLLYRLDTLAELWKLPYLPITPTFPLLGPLGLMPAPTRWKLRFGEPISFDHYGPEALDDHVLVGRLSERVRSAIQGLLDSGLSQRKSVWFG
jgi:1-acyl-sn-glycerol-3-phosphate acyltransferase